jgi:hypothetical protein
LWRAPSSLSLQLLSVLTPIRLTLSILQCNCFPSVAPTCSYCCSPLFSLSSPWPVKHSIILLY